MQFPTYEQGFPPNYAMNQYGYQPQNWAEYEYLEAQKKTGKKRKRTNNPIIQNPNRKRAKARGPLRAPSAKVLFKEERLAQLGRGVDFSSTEEQINQQWNKDVKIQEEYKQIAGHIFSELQKIKVWEAEMQAYKAHEVTQEEQEGEGNAMRPQLFESEAIKNGTASFLQSVQIFGTNTQDQKECFEEKYKIFRTQNGVRLPPATVGGTTIDLFQLYKHVVLRGGLAQCLRKESFLQIGRKLRLHGTEETLPYSLRIIYFKYLFDFEQEQQVVSGRGQGKKKIYWEQDYTGAACSRPLQSDKLEKVPNGLADDIFGQEFVRSAAQALMSHKPEAMTWALNRLMYASYQSHTIEFLLINKHPHLVDSLIALLGIPEDVNQINSLVPLMNDWEEGPELKGLCVDLFGPEPTLRRKFTLSALRILTNLSLTSQNQPAFIKNKHLRTGFLKKIITCEDLAVKAGCMKVLSNIAWRWNLNAKTMSPLIEAVREGLSMYAFDDQHSDMPALAQATLKLLSGLAANQKNSTLLIKHLTEDIYKQASFFILSTDLNIRLVALESMCHLCDIGEAICKRILSSTNSLDYMASIIKEAEIPSSIQKSCAYLASKLLGVVSQDAKFAQRFSAHFCAFASASAGNKDVFEYSVHSLSSTSAYQR